MNKIVVFLVAFFFFGFSSGPNVKLKVTNVEPLGEGKFAVALQFHNLSSTKISYLSMYCSYEGFYVTDNPNVTVIPKPCDKNFPTKETIVRNSYQTAKLNLQLDRKAKKEQFKIGFRFIEIPDNIGVTEFDSTTVKSITIWSNTVEFRNR